MPSIAGFAELTNGSVWYDERGQGEPIVLLHGGRSTRGSSTTT